MMRCQPPGCISIEWASVAAVTLHELAFSLKQVVVLRAAVGGSKFDIELHDFLLYFRLSFTYSLLVIYTPKVSLFHHFLAFGGLALPVVGH